MQRDLLAAILADPEDDALRLVYADWLEDRGDPLAELTRLQVRLRRDEEVDAPVAGLRRRERELLAGLDPDGRAYSDSFVPDGKDWTFRVDRGLVTLRLRLGRGKPKLPPKSWFDRFGHHLLDLDPAKGRLTLKHLAAVFASDAFARCFGLDLGYQKAGPEAAKFLATRPESARLLSLDLDTSAIGHEGLVALADSPHFPELLVLDISDCKGGDAGYSALGRAALPRLRSLKVYHATPAAATALAAAEGMPRLRSLGLSMLRLPPAAAEALADGAFPDLVELMLPRSGIDAACARRLAAGTGLPKLEKLLLNDNPLTDAGAVALIESPNRRGLHTLGVNRTRVKRPTAEAFAATDRFFRGGRFEMWSCKVSDDAIKPLADSPHAASLTSLRLGFSRVTDKGARYLAESPHLRNLRRLDLVYGRVRARGAIALTGDGVMPELRSLDLADNPIGDAGALALARWTAARGVRSLGLSGTGVTTKGVRELAAMPGLAAVRSLDLGANSLGDGGLAALAGSPHLANLEHLSLHGVDCTSGGAMALCASPYLPASLDLFLADDDIGEEAEAAIKGRFLGADA